MIIFMFYFGKSVHYLIVLSSYQRVYPDAHCLGIEKSKGLQSLAANAGV